MNEHDIAIFDIETDGLNPTKIHVLSVWQDGKYKHTVNYNHMRSFFKKAKILVGHNIIRFDIPVVERLLGIKIDALLVDTLALSWYLYPERRRHGLEEWGEEFGIPKPPIGNWENLSVEEYIHRCNEDVKINLTLWNKMSTYLSRIYNNEEKIWEFIEYLSFKMDCAREQERSKWKLDVGRVRAGLSELNEAKDSKIRELAQAMPKVARVAKRSKPAKPFKKDGSPSAHGEKWFQLLEEHNLMADFDGEIEEVVGYNEANPNSHQQVKEWLYSLGWKPETFKYVRDKETGDVRKIPQINLEHGGGICPSIKRLYHACPELELLEGLGVISHRISILNGFLSNADSNNFVEAQIQGFTNTLRVKHAVCVNLPGVDKPYGELIRGCLIARDGMELCGSDMSSLEDRLKCHFIYPYDKEYAEEISTPGYDPHLSLALSDNAITKQQMQDYLNETSLTAAPMRKRYKAVNYAAQYGAGGPRIAITAGVSKKQGQDLHAAYWKKNWAIKAVAEDQRVKNVDGQMWLYNPVSGFYYSLRWEKDKFSTLVQGTASYVFDEWVRLIRSKRSQLTAQFHDEIVLEIKKGYREQCESLIRWAIKELNNKLQLNRELGADVQFGINYSEIH